MKKMIGLLAVLGASVAYAGGVQVEDLKKDYISKSVVADQVQGVKLRLALKIVRWDCNKRDIVFTHTLISGNGDGWYDKYFLDGEISQTKMNCPLDEPVKEMIYSEPLLVRAFSNKNVDGEVVISVISPKDFSLDVTAVK